MADLYPSKGNARRLGARRREIVKLIAVLYRELRDIDAALTVARQRPAPTKPRFNPGSRAVKLTDAEAQAIIEDPRPQKDIAAAYGVSPAIVSSIKLGLSWRHLDRSKLVHHRRSHSRIPSLKHGGS